MKRLAAKFAHAWQIDATGLALCAVLSGAAYFVGVQPTLDRRAAQDASQAALTDARAHATSLTGTVRNLRNQINATQESLSKVEIKLQSAHGVNECIAELTAMAGECGLEVQYMQTGNVTMNPRYGTLPIQVAGTGTYRTCAEFLHKLHEKYPDTGVKAFDLSAASGDVTPLVGFNLQLTWHVQARK